jgi:hypothetical protein
VLSPFVVAFGPVLPASMVHEASRTEELAERRRTHRFLNDRLPSDFNVKDEGANVEVVNVVI